MFWQGDVQVLKEKTRLFYKKIESTALLTFELVLQLPPVWILLKQIVPAEHFMWISEISLHSLLWYYYALKFT